MERLARESIEEIQRKNRPVERGDEGLVQVDVSEDYKKLEVVKKPEADVNGDQLK